VHSGSFTVSQEQNSGDSGSLNITAYEGLDGGVTEIADSDNAPETFFTARKTFYQESPALSVHPGDTFTVPGFTGNFTCTSASISDEMIHYDASNGITRLWQVSLDGTSQSNAETDSDINVKRMDVDISREVNGSTVRTISGRLVLLLNSATPISRITISATGETAACPVQPGNSYSHSGFSFLVTRTSSRRVVAEKRGAIVKTLYEYTIEGEV
jgi:hypothetical protein